MHKQKVQQQKPRNDHFRQQQEQLNELLNYLQQGQFIMNFFLVLSDIANRDLMKKNNITMSQ